MTEAAAAPAPPSNIGSIDQRYDEASHQVEFGTLAEQLDETAHDRRRNNDDDDKSEVGGRINFPVDRLYGRDEEIKLLKRICMNAAEVFSPHTQEVLARKKIEEGGFPSRVLFLGGLSGAGKSALIQRTIQELRMESQPFFFLSGKYANTRTKAPFSALSEALKRFVREMVRKFREEDLVRLRKRLWARHLTEDSEETHVLASVMIPSISRLFQNPDSSDDDIVSVTSRSTTTSDTMGSTGGIGYDMNAIKYAFLSLMTGLPTNACPLILFLDDLQWADDSSLDLLKWMLKHNARVLRNFVIIGAYRSNEVYEGHPFLQLIEEVDETRQSSSNYTEDSSAWQVPTVYSVELSNLDQDDVAMFIADSLERSVEDVAAITEAVFSKTLGNIFFVKEALEELVRCNAIYYDIISYQWQIRNNVNQASLLEEFLVGDVVAMVQNKLSALPPALKQALSVAALTRNILDVGTLRVLLQAENLVSMDNPDIPQFLRKAVHHGILLELHSSSSLPDSSEKDSIGLMSNATLVTYKFAHDRIQEAAIACVPKGDERNQLMLRIANTLLECADSDGEAADENSWMLFVAVHHKNKLPSGMVDASELVQLNLRVGKIAMSKASFAQAAYLLRCANTSLQTMVNPWKDSYGLTLELSNMLLRVEHKLGNEEQAISVALEVVEKARSLDDQGVANVILLEAQAALNHPYHAKTIPQALDILKRNGVDIPVKPSPMAVIREMSALRWSQSFRPLHELIASFPPSTEPLLETQLRLITRTVYYSFNSRDLIMAFLLTCRGMRLVLKRKMITKDVPNLALCMGLPSRIQEKFDACAAFAEASNAVIGRFPDEPPKNFARVQYIILTGLSMIQIPYAEGANKFLALQKTLLTNGENEDSFQCAMYFAFAFFNASLPMNALIKDKLDELQELATSLGRKNFVDIFALFRQMLANLQGKAADATSLFGPIYNEKKAFEGLEEEAAKLTLHDLSVCRLLLATIFDDVEVMAKMLDTLDPYPVFDSDLPRQYFRMMWVGLAASTLEAREKKPKKKHIRKWSKTCRQHFQNYASAGSPNGPAPLACLLALRKNTRKSFDHAIDVSSGANHLCLAGLMNERCAELFAVGSEQHEKYIKEAYLSYQDWGADAKMRQLEVDNEFLRNSNFRNISPSGAVVSG